MIWSGKKETKQIFSRVEGQMQGTLCAYFVWGSTFRIHHRPFLITVSNAIGGRASSKAYIAKPRD